jgi:ribose-phosphate pyrophosphokinase
VSPDAGSEKKIERIAKKLGLNKIIKASKVRDTKTGKIKETKLHIDFEFNIHDLYIVIDDICDGGRTFIELAKVLKTYCIQDINLFVTHGIFSNGLDELFEYYKKIYCNHTLNNIEIHSKCINSFKITGQFNK